MGIKYTDSRGTVICYSANMRQARKDIVDLYVKKYLESVLEKYPSLYGMINLELKNYGFVARFMPRYTMVINQKMLEERTFWRIKYLTSVMLAMFEYHEKAYYSSASFKETDIQKIANTISFARGYALEFLLTCQYECDRSICDFRYKFCGIKCSKFFNQPCKILDAENLKELANTLSIKANQIDTTFPTN